MRILLLLSLLFTSPLYASSHITELLTLADEGHDFSQDLMERIEDEAQRWDAPKTKKRFFWREIVMQTHLYPFFKDFALTQWIQTSQEIGYSMQDFEDLAVYAHYELLQCKQEKKADQAEIWSMMIMRLKNELSNMDESKQKRELIKILKIRIDPKIIALFI